MLAAEREAAAQARLREARQEQEQVMRGVAEAHKELAGLRAEIQVGRACVCVCGGGGGTRSWPGCGLRHRWVERVCVCVCAGDQGSQVWERGPRARLGVVCAWGRARWVKCVLGGGELGSSMANTHTHTHLFLLTCRPRVRAGLSGTRTHTHTHARTYMRKPTDCSSLLCRTCGQPLSCRAKRPPPCRPAPPTPPASWSS